MIKNKYLLLGALLILCFFLGANYAQAAFEVTYPKIPGLVSPSPSCSGRDCLPIFIAYWFGILIYAAMFVSLVSFTVGAIGLLNPNLEGHNDAKDRMKGAALGLGLTLISFVLIRTINSNLITPSLTPIPGVDGVYYYNSGTKERKPVGMEVANVPASAGELIQNGFNQLIYDCSDSNIAPTLLVWLFPQTGLEGGSQNLGSVSVQKKTCGQTVNISSTGSFRLAFETPGIYYCLGGCNGDTCAGYMSQAIATSQDEISFPFSNNIGAVMIVNQPSEGLYYGVVLHKSVRSTDGGICSLPLVNMSNSTTCKPVNMAANSSTVLKWNDANPPTTSGDGVEFYSESFGWNADAKALRATVNNQMIGSSLFYTSGCGLSFFGFNQYDDEDYNESVDRPDAYKYRCPDASCTEEGAQEWFNSYTECTTDDECAFGYICNDKACEPTNCSNTGCETFQDCSGSIKVKGSYLIGLYSKDKNNSGLYYCQTFTNSVDELGATPFKKSSSAEIERIYVIPLKD